MLYKKIFLLLPFFICIQSLYIQTTSKQLKDYERTLKNELNLAIKAIKNAFNISENIWNENQKNIRRYKSFAHTCYKNGLQATHDKQLPVEIKKSIFKEFYRVNINPNCIDIVCLYPSNWSSDFCTARTVHPKIIEQDGIVIQKAPAKLYINIPYFEHASKEEITHIIAHEVQHLIDNHGIERMFLRAMLQSIGQKKYSNTKEWNYFLQMQEKCADLLPCTRSKELAEAAVKKFSQYCFLNPFKNYFTSIYAPCNTQKIAAQHILNCYN